MQNSFFGLDWDSGRPIHLRVNDHRACIYPIKTDHLNSLGSRMTPNLVVGIVFTILPWLFLLKLRGDLNQLIILEESDGSSKMSNGRRLLPVQGQRLLDRLIEQRDNRTNDRLPRSMRWDLEIIVPAYNEELNITKCINSLSDSSLELYRRHQLRTHVMIIDDNSVDNTHQLAQACQDRLKDIIRSKGYIEHSQHHEEPVAISVHTSRDRPEGEQWLGKNWACQNGFELSTSDDLLFVDSDVTVKPEFLCSFVRSLPRDCEFTGVIAEIVCKSLIDYIAQANIATLAFINNFTTSLTPGSKKPMVFGACIYISRNAYLITGGYKAANSDSARTRGLETRAIATNIVRSGIGGINIAGGGLIQVYMYHNIQALWEGWTKNFYIAADQNMINALISILATLVLMDIPFLMLIFPQTSPLVIPFVVGHYFVRLFAYKVYKVPLKKWYLFPLGGIAFTVIMIASAYKVIYGTNWTWKGRSLVISNTK